MNQEGQRQDSASLQGRMWLLEEPATTLWDWGLGLGL